LTPSATSSSTVFSVSFALPAFSAASTPLPSLSPSVLEAAFLAFFLSFSAFFAAALAAFSSFAFFASSPPNCSRHSSSFSGFICEKR
jgi:hypothetical protein